MATGTVIMIVCAVFLVSFEIFFKKDMDEGDAKKSVYDDPDFEGADGLSGVLGLNSEDIDPFQQNNNK